jgi:hypothetical protein
MTANQTGAGVSLPVPENEKAGGEAGNLDVAMESVGRITASQDQVKPDRYLMRALRGGDIDCYRRLAHVAAAAARKGVE